jgi:DNA-binding NarL/FixJ family response regulator
LTVRVLICDDQTVVREGLAAILSTDPEIQVVGLAGNGQDALLKDTRRDLLVSAIKGTAEGQSYLDPAIAGKVMQQAATSPEQIRQRLPEAEALTEREQEVLALLAQGHSNPEIARRLHLAAGTVRNYVSVIFQKLGVSDRTQAAVVAVQHGLVDDGEG